MNEVGRPEMVLLASGEYYALKGLIDPDWSVGQFAAVVASMATGLIAIVASAIAGASSSHHR